MLSVPDANSVNYNLFRPYTNYGDVTVLRYDGFSNYNAMNVKYQLRNIHSSGLSLVTNYTWAHSIDTSSEISSRPTCIASSVLSRFG